MSHGDARKLMKKLAVGSWQLAAALPTANCQLPTANFF
jgi:hypothetical protein